jgi:hypothetical protein
LAEELLIDKVSDRADPHEPFGCHHWPQYPWMSYSLVLVGFGGFFYL